MFDILAHDGSSLSWNLRFTRDLFEWEVSLVGSLVDLLSSVYISDSDKDSRVWSLFSNGSFSSKSFYHVLSEEPLSQPSYPLQNV